MRCHVSLIVCCCLILVVIFMSGVISSNLYLNSFLIIIWLYCIYFLGMSFIKGMNGKWIKVSKERGAAAIERMRGEVDFFFLHLFSRMKLINNGQNKLVRKNSSCFNVIPFTSSLLLLLLSCLLTCACGIWFLYIYFILLFLSPLLLVISDNLHTQNGWVRERERIRRNSTIHIHNS